MRLCLSYLLTLKTERAVCSERRPEGASRGWDGAGQCQVCVFEARVESDSGDSALARKPFPTAVSERPARQGGGEAQVAFVSVHQNMHSLFSHHL